MTSDLKDGHVTASMSALLAKAGETSKTRTPPMLEQRGRSPNMTICYIVRYSLDTFFDFRAVRIHAA